MEPTSRFVCNPSADRTLTGTTANTDPAGPLCQLLLPVLILLRQAHCTVSHPLLFPKEMESILFCTQLLHVQSPPSSSWVSTAALGPKRVVTFGSAELAGVDATVVLMHRGEKQLAFPAIKMHLAFEQRRLQQAAAAHPVYFHVGRTCHQALKQRHLPGPYVHVLQGGQHGQGPAFRVCWGRQSWGARTEQRHMGQGKHTHAHTERQTDRERDAFCSFADRESPPAWLARAARRSPRPGFRMATPAGLGWWWGVQGKWRDQGQGN